MQAVDDVYKSSSADQIEGGTGGSVDLRTKLPFDFKKGLHFAGSGDLSFGDLARRPTIRCRAWCRANGTPVTSASSLDGASQLTSTSQNVRMEPMFRTRISGKDYFIPGGYQYGEEDFQRKRDGIYGAVQWAPSNDLTFTGLLPVALSQQVQRVLLRHLAEPGGRSQPEHLRRQWRADLLACRVPA
jgi:hypothetical protein